MPSETPPATFLAVDPVDEEAAWATVRPAPYDRAADTATGTRAAPEAIVAASRYVETYDLEIGRDPTDRGLHTAGALSFDYADGEASTLPVTRAVRAALAADRPVLLLGGDSTILCGAADALAERGGIGIVRLEGALGCDDEYRGVRRAPRTATRRASERAPLRVLGHRVASRAGREYAAAAGIIADPADPVAGLPASVWIAIDLSVLDPSVMSMPGNLEPGGWTYARLAGALAAVFAARRVVGAELTGLVPPPADIGPAFVAARIALRILALAHRQRFP